jgi:DNA-binding NarL/FixJ family response regulator
MRWTARAVRDQASRKLRIRLLPTRGIVRTGIPVEVVLTGAAPSNARTQLPKRKPKVLSANGVETTFDAAASRSNDVRVIVVDADQFGLAFIRDLHVVFPSVRIIALSSSPRMMVRALKTGATIAMPRSTPPALLARVIRRLLAGPKKPSGKSTLPWHRLSGGTLH